MTKEERCRFDAIEKDIRGIQDDLHILVTNHLAHIKSDLESLKDDMEQTYGVADDAAKKSARTEKFVAGSVVFLA